MEYNYKDQLTKKSIAQASNGNYLQGIDYAYNVRGWLTNINAVSVTSAPIAILTPSMTGMGTIQNMAIVPYLNQALSDKVNEVKNTTFALPPVVDNTDLFSENIYYNGTDSRFQAKSQYNGNIQSVAWQVDGRTAQGYGYTYDELDRLTEAKYYDLTSSGTSPTTFSTDFKFNEKLTYDMRGNILTLKRNGFKLPAFTANNYAAADYGQIDNLVYTYNAQNQVTKITDDTDQEHRNKGFKFLNIGASTNYEYDANGNLIRDDNKGITNIEYNYLNLPQTITFTDDRKIEFIYDAGGAKLRKIVTDINKDIVTTTDYVNGVEYKNTVLDRVAHTEGSISRQGDGKMQMEYVLRDHLGNTRVTFSDADNNGVVTKDDIKQINSYYAFGLNMEGNFNGAEGNNKYQLTGKEWNDDFGLGMNDFDFGARMYDPAIGRWNATDPLASKFISHTPYNYVLNRPTNMIDPNGMESEAYGSAFNGLKKGEEMYQAAKGRAEAAAKAHTENSKSNSASNWFIEAKSTLTANIDRTTKTANISHNTQTKLFNKETKEFITINETSKARIVQNKTKNEHGNNMFINVAEDFGTNISDIRGSKIVNSYRNKPSVAGLFANAMLEGISEHGWTGYSLKPNKQKDLNDYINDAGGLLVKYVPYARAVEDLFDKAAAITDRFLDKDNLRVTTTLPLTPLVQGTDVSKLIEKIEN